MAKFDIEEMGHQIVTYYVTQRMIDPLNAVTLTAKQFDVSENLVLKLISPMTMMSFHSHEQLQALIEKLKKQGRNPKKEILGIPKKTWKSALKELKAERLNKIPNGGI